MKTQMSRMTKRAIVMFVITAVLAIFAFTQPSRTIDSETGKEIAGNVLITIGYTAAAITFFAGTWFMCKAPTND